MAGISRHFLVVMMTVMVMMVVMTRVTVVLYMAVGFVAMLALGFKLDGNVIDPVLGKLFSDLVLDVVRLFACHRVKSGVI